MRLGIQHQNRYFIYCQFRFKNHSLPYRILSIYLFPHCYTESIAYRYTYLNREYVCTKICIFYDSNARQDRRNHGQTIENLYLFFGGNMSMQPLLSIENQLDSASRSRLESVHQPSGFNFNQSICCLKKYFY